MNKVTNKLFLRKFYLFNPSRFRFFRQHNLANPRLSKLDNKAIKLKAQNNLDNIQVLILLIMKNKFF